MTTEKKTPPPTPAIALKGYRVLVRLDMVETGLELAEKSEHFIKDRGTVVAIGDGRYEFSGSRAKFDVNLGDRVLLSEYAVTEYDAEDGWSYRVVNANDLLAVIPPFQEMPMPAVGEMSV